MRVELKNGVTLEFDSTGMVEDFRDCARMAEEPGGDGIGLCMIPEVEKALEGEKCEENN